MDVWNEGWGQSGGCKMQARNRQDTGHIRAARNQVGYRSIGHRARVHAMEMLRVVTPQVDGGAFKHWPVVRHHTPEPYTRAAVAEPFNIRCRSGCGGGGGVEGHGPRRHPDLGTHPGD